MQSFSSCLPTLFLLICILFPFNVVIKGWCIYIVVLFLTYLLVDIEMIPQNAKEIYQRIFPSFLSFFSESSLSFVVINKASFLPLCEF